MAARLEKKELLQAVASWGFCAGYRVDLAKTLPRAIEWTRALWEAGQDHLPLDLVHDLGHLLLLGRGFVFASSHLLEAWDEEERQWRLDYEDRVLGRWILDPSLQQAHVLVAGLEDERQRKAVVHTLALALGGRGAGALDLVLGNSAFLRSEQAKLSLWLADLPADPSEWKAAVDPAWVSWAINQRHAVFQLHQRKRLLSAEDLWEIAHLEALPNESTRLALRQIHQTVSVIGPADQTTSLTVKRRRQEIPIDETTADQYPAGGFAALTTRGRFENLVRSEIAYVGEGGIDLFDVRFAQGELLFYTRDESPMLDGRVEVTILVDRLPQMRHKHPALFAQTLVMVQGIALRMQTDLVAILGPSAVVINLQFLVRRPEERRVIEEELGLLRLALADEIAHQRCRLEIIERMDDARSRGRLVFSPGPNVGRFDAKAWIRVGEQTWLVDEEEIDVSDPAGARELADTLLARIW